MSVGYKKKCPICGTKWIALKPNATYCSNKCRTRAHRERKEAQTQSLATQVTAISRYMTQLDKEYAKLLMEIGDQFGQDASFFVAQRLGEIQGINISLDDLILDFTEIVQDKTEDEK